MPLVEIVLPPGRDQAYRRAVADGVHQAMVDAIAIPEDDRFQFITEVQPCDIIAAPHYLGIERGADAFFIRITLRAGRTPEMKQALYRGIVARLEQHPGVRPADVQVVLVENGDADWSVGNGEAPLLRASSPPVIPRLIGTAEPRPVADPITGEEHLGDLSQPIQALAHFYRAFNGRNLALMEANWDHSGEAAMDNPLGGIVRGWPEIRAVYERIFDGAARVQVEFHDYTLHRAGEVCWAVGRERGKLESGGISLDLAIRTSRLFRRTDGGWRQLHHHGSIDDPELLRAYQFAVTGKSRPVPSRRA